MSQCPKCGEGPVEKLVILSHKTMFGCDNCGRTWWVDVRFEEPKK
jgi:uncharacterized Zn finger protein